MNVPSDPKAKQKIKNALNEISDSMLRASSERDLVKTIINNICEEFDLDKKIFRKMAKVHFNSNYSEEVRQHEEFELLYENITNIQVNTDE